MSGAQSLAPHREGEVRVALDRWAGTRVPGLQYVAVEAERTLFEHAGGWADLLNRRAMTLETTMMAYSVTKTLTAVAALQWVEKGRLGLEDEVVRFLPSVPPDFRCLTIRQLITHTSGLPNPIPLRWVHLAEEHARHDEAAALERVLRAHSSLRSRPGQRYAYSNLGYWLLGRIVEQVSERPFADYVRESILSPLGLPPRLIGFEISDPAKHANGYLARCSVMNLLKGLLMDSRFFGGNEGRWLRLRSHYLDGAAFGGLVGTAPALARFLQDQLRTESVLLGPELERLLATRQSDSGGAPIPMTLGWHLGDRGGEPYLFKEGGGGGFHAEIRIYPRRGVGSVVMVNATQFDSTAFLNRIDSALLGSSEHRSPSR